MPRVRITPIYRKPIDVKALASALAALALLRAKVKGAELQAKNTKAPRG